MEKYNQGTQTNNSNSFASSSERQNLDNNEIVNMNKNQAQEEKSNESTAFAQVMSQLNIADINTFNTHYEQLWFQASENKEMLSIMICEIDSFNEYNEHYGHQATSFMLVVVALELKKRCEEFGVFLARYKTGKFAVLIKKGNINTVEKMAESLRLSIEQTHTEHKASKVSNVVTLSIGISNIYPTSMDVLINKADRALTSAKISGNTQTLLPFVEEPKVLGIHLATNTEEVLKQENVQPAISPEIKEEKTSETSITPEKETLTSNKNTAHNEEIDMISQLEGLTPSSHTEEFKKQTTEKVNLLSILKKKIPSSKQSNKKNEEQSANKNEIISAQQDKEKIDYEHLKAELEALKRKSEAPTTVSTAPIRYY